MWSLEAQITTKCHDKGTFQDSVEVWITRPNLSNKIVSCSTITEANNNIKLEDYKILTQSLPSPWFLQNYSDCSVRLRKLVPKKSSVFSEALELIVFNPATFCYTFIPLNPTNLGYDSSKIAYAIRGEFSQSDTDECGVYLWTTTPSESSTDVETDDLRDCHPMLKWLKSLLLPSICKWMKDPLSDGAASQKFPVSNSLINSEQYARTYEELKDKYGKKISESWSEVTDPQKYVTEDVAIASYLLVLWKSEREEKGMKGKQSFVDIGCGNGLLTHILTCEGHEGKGLDLRARRVWSSYGSETKLEEHCVTPDDLTAIEGYDWLLGNHCDELTPWLPVMAVKCASRLWVLPCCFFDFFGKYSRGKACYGQYQDYIEYISSVCKKCGYTSDVDVMRIPSTKRVCIVGKETDYQRKNRKEILLQISQFVDARKFLQQKSNDNIATRFVPRAKIEPVQNCTRLDSDVRKQVIDTVTDRLLMMTNEIVVFGGKRKWNKGGKIELSELAGIFGDDIRQKLKKECGGLQTLLRNHHQVFLVQQGCVELRDWSNANCELGKKRKKKRRNTNNQQQHNSVDNCRKTKPCWFDTTHPDGCPRISQDCPFLHKTDDHAS